MKESEKGADMRIWKNQKGNEFVEASIAIPIITMVVILILNLFVFYLNILVTGVCAHKEVTDAWDSENNVAVKTQTRMERIQMPGTGLLRKSLSSDLEIKSYHFNEDFILRAKELIHEE